MRATGEQLKVQRKLVRLSQGDLAGKLGVGQSEMSRLENVQALPPHHVKRLDEIFGGPAWRSAPVQTLRETYTPQKAYSQGDVQPIIPRGGLHHVPLVGVAGADIFEFSFDAPVEEYLPFFLEGPAGRKLAAFKVSGSCMEPTVHAGECVIVAEAETVPDGKLGVFRLDGGCTLKRPFRKDDYIELRPDNPKFKAKRYATNKLEVVGVVVGFFRKP